MTRHASKSLPSAAESAQNVVKQSLDLLRQLAHGQRADFDDLKQRAQTLTAAHDENLARFSRERGQLRDKARAVDAWIFDIFGATERAIPRETLVEEFLARYREERHIADSEKHAGPWLFLFETEHEQGRLLGLRPRASAGVHPEAFRRLCAEHLPRAADDPFLGALVDSGQDIEGWHAQWFAGSPLFDHLLDISRRFGGEPDYWVNGVLLPGDGRYESLALLILHPNAGDLLRPEPPTTMRQDQRLLMALVLVWRQLEHQIKSLKALSEADRRELIQLIAPGLLHHEIGAVMRTLDAQAVELFHLLKDQALAARAAQDTPLGLAVRYAHGIGTLAGRLFRITDAFNNLDKRSEVESTDLGHIFAELRLLLTHRLGALGVDFSYPEAVFQACRVHTDAVLLEQALLNILNNALNALDEGATPPPRRIRAYVEKREGRLLTVAVVNNGPPIPPDRATDIFRRGYTTRVRGHGQGLYLARLIAHYLGGGLDLMTGASLPDGFPAGFLFSLTSDLAAKEGVSRAAR